MTDWDALERVATRVEATGRSVGLLTRPGDVPYLSSGNGVQVVAESGFDLWRNGSRALKFDISEDEAVAALVGEGET